MQLYYVMSYICIGELPLCLQQPPKHICTRRILNSDISIPNCIQQECPDTKRYVLHWFQPYLLTQDGISQNGIVEPWREGRTPVDTTRAQRSAPL